MLGFLDTGGMFTSLDPFGSTAVTINGINDNGRVVGFYVDAASGNTIGTVGAVPEPASLSLLAVGLFGMGAFAPAQSPITAAATTRRAGLTCPLAVLECSALNS